MLTVSMFKIIQYQGRKKTCNHLTLKDKHATYVCSRLLADLRMRKNNVFTSHGALHRAVSLQQPKLIHVSVTKETHKVN